MRKMNRFAHMVGLPGHLDPLPGAEDHAERSRAIHSEERANRMGLVAIKYVQSSAQLEDAQLVEATPCSECCKVFPRTRVPENPIHAQNL